MCALANNELFASTTRDANLRAVPKRLQPATFAAGSALLKKLTPLGYDKVNNKWVVWVPPVTEVSKITANATPATDGTFTITVDGETTAAIDHDAAAAAVKTALVALSNVQPADVDVADFGGGLGAASGGVDITWKGALAGRELAVTADFTGLTGNVHVLSEETAGVDGDGKDEIHGFVWPDDVQLDAGGEVIGNVLIEGQVHRDDIPVVAPATQSTLDAALADGEVRKRGLFIQGLANFH